MLQQNEDLSSFAEHTEFALPTQAVEPHATLDIPPQLVWECAAGLEDPQIVAARHGFEGAKWERLSQWPPFITAVQAQRAEFDRDGVTFRLKAGLMAEQMMDMMFKQAVGVDTTILQKLSVFNALTDVAGLKPDKNAKSQGAADATPKFSITINLPGNQPAPLTIDG